MNTFVTMALAATLMTWFVTALGAATVVFFKSPNPKFMNITLGFASGVMISASFWSLLQPAIERAEASSALPAYLVATLGFLLGALFMWASDKAVAFARKKADGASVKPRIDISYQNLCPGHKRARIANEPPVHKIMQTSTSIKILISLFFFAAVNVKKRNK